MLDLIMDPEVELKKINKVIREYEAILKTSIDVDQRGRVSKELKELKSYRDKIVAMNIISEPHEEDTPEYDELLEFPFLKMLLDKNKEKIFTDSEANSMYRYMEFFEKEFLPFLSETKLKLDFKYSLERDGFYHRFQDLLRRMQDFIGESRRIEEGTFRADVEEEMKKRNFKMKRILSLEMDRFFKSIVQFSADLIDDIEEDSLKCLNGNDMITFDPIEGKRYLEDSKVCDALENLLVFSDEIIKYLNVPDIVIKE